MIGVVIARSWVRWAGGDLFPSSSVPAIFTGPPSISRKTANTTEAMRFTPRTWRGFATSQLGEGYCVVMAHGNLEIVRRWFAAGNARDTEVLREVVHPEFVFAPHITGGHEGLEFRGVDGPSSFLRLQAETWESLQAEPSEMRQNGDVVVVLGTIRARGRGSGVDVEEPTIWVCRCLDGLILRIEARTARDPAQVGQALAEAGLPPHAFDTHEGEAAGLNE